MEKYISAPITKEAAASLKAGDYVVHENHGLGIYQGIEKIEVDKIVKDYIIYITMYLIIHTFYRTCNSNRCRYCFTYSINCVGMYVFNDSCYVGKITKEIL